MALWTCTCRKFQLDQLPCDHVLAVVRKTQYDPYDLCSLYYTREFWCETYRGVIQPIPHISSWVVPPAISTFQLNPPDVRTVAGRRRKSRIPSMGEELPTPKCSRCKGKGHNRATCQNPIALRQSEPGPSLLSPIAAARSATDLGLETDPSPSMPSPVAAARAAPDLGQTSAHS